MGNQIRAGDDSKRNPKIGGRLMQCWLYSRVSTFRNICRNCRKIFLDSAQYPVCPACGSKDIEKSQDTENQLIILRQWAASLGHTVVAEYVDRASGKTAERTEFKRMMIDLHARQPRSPVLIAFWALDRLSREGVEQTLKHLRIITEAGGHWKSYTEQYLDSLGPFSEAVIALLACLAKQQRVRLSENTRAGIERARITGTKTGRPHGRPESVSRELVLEVYGKTKSYRGAARVLQICTNTVRNAVIGRPEEQPKAIEWSDPVWGKIVDGMFVEDRAGRTVVRFDLGTQQAHCMNHQQLLSLCRHLHKPEDDEDDD
jgi:DNA invertase Pin-like site-specific DNA recombinase